MDFKKKKMCVNKDQIKSHPLKLNIFWRIKRAIKTLNDLISINLENIKEHLRGEIFILSYMTCNTSDVI